jgi:hypothetical protein
MLKIARLVAAQNFEVMSDNIWRYEDHSCLYTYISSDCDVCTFRCIALKVGF